ncbi:hypothetical protein [Streptomyces daliensis]
MTGDAEVTGESEASGESEKTEASSRQAGVFAYSDEQRERWRVLQDESDRRRRRKRIAGWAAVCVLVLGAAGWLAAPTVKDLAIESGACDEGLPEGGLDSLRALSGDPDEHLASSESHTDAQLGRYHCEVTTVERGRVVEVEAVTSRDDVDAELVRHFADDGGRPRAALPAGLPGFESTLTGIVLTPSCPGLGEDATGRAARLVVEVHGGGLDRDPVRLLRPGVALANKASEKLGCDSEPLPVPAENVAAKTVRPVGTAGTACAALARGPLQGDGWTVEMGTPDSPAPMVSCAVRPSGENGDGDPQRTVLELNAWYGDWVPARMQRQARMDGTSDGEGGTRAVTPWLTGERGWATATCEGRPAGFELWVDREKDDSDSEDRALDKSRYSEKEMRKALTAFAKSQSELRDCHGLRLPETAER